MHESLPAGGFQGSTGCLEPQVEQGWARPVALIGQSGSKGRRPVAESEVADWAGRCMTQQAGGP